jgi:transcriptional regulator GlxA family with amidase domain
LSDTAEHAAQLAEDMIRLAHGDVRLKLATAAKELDIPLRTLERHFRRIYHSAPKAYQIRVRVEWACELIRRHPTQKLESIAVQMGYQDVSDFARLFRKELGVSPQEYRYSLKQK